MTAISLGAQLAQTKTEEKNNSRLAAERRAQAESAAAGRNFRRLVSFFENAKDYFTEGIRSATPTKDLSILVGTPWQQTGDNKDVHDILELWASNPPRITQRDNRFHSLWAEFSQWAAGNGLVAEWQYCYDGGGMTSWYELTVKPAAAAKNAAKAFVNPNDVLVQHAYCLHVLRSTSQGLLDAAKALSAVGGVPVAETALKRLAPLIASTEELVKKLDE